MISSFKYPQVIASALVLAAIGLGIDRARRGGEEVVGEGATANSKTAESVRARVSVSGGESAPESPAAATVKARMEIASSGVVARSAATAAALSATDATSRKIAERSVVAKRHAALSLPAFKPVDSFAPGNALPVRGGALLVQAVRPMPLATGQLASHDPTPLATSPELDVKFSPVDPASAKTAGGGAVDALPDSTGSTAAEVNRPGLTYEQELFRTKWGWVAFDRAQRQGSEFGAEP